ncbi:15274_t:CDS:10 [Acaulospora morrowiae]|uniref:15274_t:CDS:1 n=1 Tax=Acaulospora morrowiae TaxID=94023 RepID=A0A9N8V146_9GLOM|nr:15274_t:CDS:10 [Acaulospora morrowiae]
MSSTTLSEHSLKDLDHKLLGLLHKAYVLVGPADEESQQAESLQERLSSRLNQISDEGNQQSEELNKNKTIRETFVAKCLEILEALESTLRSINDIKNQTLVGNNKLQEPDVLGVRDLRLVHTMLEIIISWGIYPCLLPGVGIPISRRIRSGYIQNDFLEKVANNEGNTTFGDSRSKSKYLFSILKSLTNVMLFSPSRLTPITTVSSIIYRKHITDVYAALLQLAYGPILSNDGQGLERRKARQQLITVLNEENDGVNAMVDDKKPGDPELEQMRKECISLFREIFERSDSFQSLEALTTLLSSSPLHQSPKWLKNVCGRYLTRILLRQNGVKSVIEFMIGGESEASLSKVEAISQLILSVPNTVKSLEAYFSIICPQLLSIVQSSSTLSRNSDTKLIFLPIVNVASLIIARMFSKFPTITKKFIVTKVFGTMWAWWGINMKRKNQLLLNHDFTTDLDPLIMDEQTLQSTISVVHHILVGSEPIPDLLQFFLEDSVAPLYYLYSFTCHSKSFLKDIVMDILLTYFKIVSVSEGVETFKEIVFRRNKRLIAPKLGEIGEIYFAPGPSGGVVMRLRMAAINTSVTTTTLDVNVFIDFVKSISKNELSGDLFMYLLTEYTSSLSLQLQEPNPRRILTLLHIIMSMIDNLGSTILQKPGQMIAFVNNVLEEYNLKRDNQKGHENMGMKGGFRMLKHKSLSVKDSHILNLVSNNLVPLQFHHKSSICSLSRGLRLTISAREAASQSSSSSSQNSQESQRREESLKRFQEAMDALQDEILPIKARGITMLKEMILEKDVVMDEGENLDRVFDLFIQMVQDDESFIYFNAIKGLSSLTDVHGERIIRKLMKIYSDFSQNLDNRLRVGEAILQTVQRCGDVLGKYIVTLLPPLLHVLNKDENSTLRISALSIIGCACETSPLALTSWFRDVVDWVLNILDIQSEAEIRRASTVLLISLFRGLSSRSQTIHLIPNYLLERSWRTLRYIEEVDKDELTRYQARVGLSDLEDISNNELFGNI